MSVASQFFPSSGDQIPIEVWAVGGGGGGALFAGTPGAPPQPVTLGKGGDGLPAPLFGVSLAVGGGGGGGSFPGAAVPGGTGGGGAGGVGSTGSNGTANTGGGGGGAGGSGSGGSGGSGIVVIRYPTGFAAATVTGTAPTPAQPGYNVYRWDSGPATITFN